MQIYYTCEDSTNKIKGMSVKNIEIMFFPAPIWPQLNYTYSALCIPLKLYRLMFKNGEKFLISYWHIIVVNARFWRRYIVAACK